MDVARSAFAGIPGVVAVAYGNIGKFGGKTQVQGKEFAATYQRIDENYLPVMQIPVTRGRNFSASYPSDANNSIVVNETFLKEAGWAGPAGRSVDFMNIPGWGTRKVRVIGVVKDYHFESLKEKIKPQIFTMDPALPLGRFTVRIRPQRPGPVLRDLEKVYHRLFPDQPFQYSFTSDLLLKGYESESRWKKIVSFSAFIAILISCIGLFGLAMLSAEQRVREIGIRKTLGASAIHLAGLMTIDFMKLVVVAFLIAAPIAWWVVERWLEQFAYRIPVTLWLFVLGGGTALLIAMITVGFHSVKAALANPVRALKNP